MAAINSTLRIPASKILSEFTITIEIIEVAKAKMRFHVGMFLVRFGIWITGMKAEIKAKP